LYTQEEVQNVINKYINANNLSEKKHIKLDEKMISLCIPLFIPSIRVKFLKSGLKRPNPKVKKKKQEKKKKARKRRRSKRPLHTPCLKKTSLKSNL